MTQPTREQIRSIIAECAGVAIERVVPEARLVEELGILVVRLRLAIEVATVCRTGIRELAWVDWHNVSDIYRTVERLTE